MDVGATTRVPIPPTLGEQARPVATPVEAVRTVLPSGGSVQQPSKTAATAEERPESRSAQQPAATVERQITVDIETRKVIYRALDGTTGDVIMQLPDARALEAYAEQRRKAETEDTQTASFERVA